MQIAILTMRQLIKPIYIDVSPFYLPLIPQNLTPLVATEKSKESDAAQQLAGLKLGPSNPTTGVRPPQPPRPSQPPPIPQSAEEEEEEEDDDEDNPFADSNAVTTPAYEKPEPRW